MVGNRGRRPGEVTFALILLVTSLLALWEAFTISGFSSLSGPGVFPMLAAATMVVCSLGVLVQDRALAPSYDGGAAGAFFETILPPRLLVFTAMIALYMLSLGRAGFFVSSFVFLFAGFWFLDRSSLLRAGIMSAASVAAIWVIFRYIFAVVLPRGSFI